MQSKAKTVDEYFAELPPERREPLSVLRALINRHIDPGLVEEMGYGMPGWSVPHSRFPAGYHCDPRLTLPFAGMASQKQYMSLYLCSCYIDEHADTDQAEAKWFREAWAKTGKKLDMGKSCIRFKRLDELALDVIAESFRRISMDRFIAAYVKQREAFPPKNRAETLWLAQAREALSATPAPAKRAAPAKTAPTRAAKAAVATKKPSAKKVAVKKAATKVAAKQPAARRVAAKQPAAKKTPARKAAARK
jgi:hypothetical protein